MALAFEWRGSSRLIVTICAVVVGHGGGAVGVEGIGYDRCQSGLNANGGVAKPAYIHWFISPVRMGLADVLGLRSESMGEIDFAK